MGKKTVFASKGGAMPRSSRRPVALLAALAAIAFGPGASAQAAHVQCGDVITQDTTLDSDLIDCPGDGIVIGASGITLNLNSHLIDGAFRDPDNGVDNTGGYDHVTVENGTIRDFHYGVEFQYADRGAISALRLVANSAGIFLADSADGNLVERNVARQNGDGMFLLPIVYQEHTSVLEPQFNVIRRNEFSQNQYGVWGFGSFTRMERNTINSNIESAIELVAGSTGDLLAANDLAANGEGILVVGQSNNTTVERNRIDGSASDGIQVGSAVSGTTVLAGNISNGNGDDGIDVDTTRADISRNTANGNADLGIEAVRGVTDGGGNKARGNGDPAQCLNVSCK